MGYEAIMRKAASQGIGSLLDSWGVKSAGILPRLRVYAGSRYPKASFFPAHRSIGI
jgi:hypothetical protein